MQFFGGKILMTGAAAAAMAAVLLFSLGGASTTVGLETDVAPGLDVTIAASEGSVALGGFVTISVTVVDGNGDPLADTECSFSIVSQPGDDAVVGQAPVFTDGAGNVSTTLNVGSTAGEIEIEANCGGTTVSVEIEAGDDGDADDADDVVDVGDDDDAAAPPASLPDTGNGGYAYGISSMRVALIALLAGLGFAFVGAGLLTGRLGGQRARG